MCPIRFFGAPWPVSYPKKLAIRPKKIFQCFVSFNWTHRRLRRINHKFYKTFEMILIKYNNDPNIWRPNEKIFEICKMICTGWSWSVFPLWKNGSKDFKSISKNGINYRKLSPIGQRSIFQIYWSVITTT